MPPDNQILNAGHTSKCNPLVLNYLEDALELHAQPTLAIEEQVGFLGFVAIAKITCGRDKICGLLLVADADPRPSVSMSATEALRDHASYISTLFELYLLHEDHENFRVDELEVRRVLELEAENLVLEAEADERVRIGKQLYYTATHDELTMLHNRQFFMESIVNSFERSVSEPSFQFGVLLMDLDRFKLVNDTLGHRVGDVLLIEVARRLRTSVRPNDILARIGGDEFALLLNGLEGITATEALTQRIIGTIRNPPIRIGHEEIKTSCSVGVVQAPRHGRTPEELLHNADIAMYNAKRRQLGYSIFSEAMQNELLANAQLRTELEKAMARSEFYILYQPICQINSSNVIGFEALVRWQHPRRGVVLPELFIAAAESSGLIRQLGFWILQTACAQLSTWQEQFPDLSFKMSVNVSGEQLKDAKFAKDLEETLRTTAIPGQKLQLEVTQSAFLASIRASQEIASDIRSLGVAIALDEFGTSHSSLADLDQYPVDSIKIDSSFISSIQTRPRTMAIVEAIIQLCRALNVKVIAEGVEDDEQRQALDTAGCMFGQGCVFAAPLSPVQATKMLKRFGGKAHG